jgi:hypothetical protein
MRAPILLLAALLGLGSGVLSQTPGNSRIQLQGIARDADTGRPLPKISIWDGEKSSTTDAAGRFVIAGLSPGRLRLSASGVGYILDGLTDPKIIQRTVYRPDGVYVTLGPETPIEITLYMRPSPFITGTVLDSFGQPVLRAMVTAHRLTYDANGNPTLGRQLIGETDDRGVYETESLPPGDYVFRAEKSRPEADPRLPFTRAYHPANSGSARPETITIGRETTRLPPMVLASAPGSRLQVQVVNDTGRDPLGFTSVYLSRKDDLSPMVSLFTSFASGNGGSVRLPAGSYIVDVAVRESQDRSIGADTAAFRSRVSFEIREQDIVLPVTLSRGTGVEGQVVKREKNGDMNPFPGMLVRLAEDTPQFSMLLGGTSASDGKFAFSSVPEGSYRLRVPRFGEDSGTDFRDRDLSASPRGVCFGELRQDNTILTGDRVKIAGPSTILTVVLRDSTTRVRGKVVDSRGHAASSAIVALIPSDRSLSANLAAVTADQNGDYEFTCAPAGGYKVFAWTTLPGAAYRNEEFMAQYRDRGTPVRLADGDNLTVNTELIE